MKVLIKADLTPHTASGYDGLGIALALRQAGADVHLDPRTVQAPLPPDVAELLTKRASTAYDLLISHGTPTQLPALTAAERRSAALAVAWTCWHTTSLDHLKGRSALRRNLSEYDLVVGYDALSTSALQPYVTSSSATVQGGFWPRLWPAVDRDFFAPNLKIGLVAEDPLTAIDAYIELRRDNPDLPISLTVNTPTPIAATGLPGLHVFTEDWDDETLHRFFASQHVLLALGPGSTPALQFLSTGAPVIATNWGGHQQWLSPAIGYPLHYELYPDSTGHPDSLTAVAAKEHLKALMLHAAAHRDELRRKGELAADLVPQMCGWDKVIDRLTEKIAAVPGDRGGHVITRYRAAKARIEESRQAVSFL